MKLAAPVAASVTRQHHSFRNKGVMGTQASVLNKLLTDLLPIAPRAVFWDKKDIPGGLELLPLTGGGEPGFQSNQTTYPGFCKAQEVWWS